MTLLTREILSLSELQALTNILKRTPGNIHSMIIVLGDAIVDQESYGFVERISPESPVPVVDIQGDFFRLGGAANVAHNVKTLGGHIHLLSVLGNDDSGQRLKGLTSELEIASHWIIDVDRPTTTKTRVFAGGWHQVVRLDRESNLPINQAILDSLVENVSVVLPKCSLAIISDYQKGVVTKDWVPAFISQCRKRNIPVIVDSKSTDLRHFANATLFTPNLKEAAGVLGKHQLNNDDDDEIANAAKRIREENQFENVLITRGERGMTLATEKGAKHFRSTKRAVSDLTGAGDTAVAMLAVALNEGRDLEEAVKLANIAAGIAVTRPGTTTVYREELIAYLTRDPSKDKIMPMKDLQKEVNNWRNEHRRIAFTNGCFDMLHAGHLRCLQEARRQGDCLIVGINSDSSVRLLKGSDRPIISEMARAEIVAALACVDAFPLTSCAALFLRPFRLLRARFLRARDFPSTRTPPPSFRKPIDFSWRSRYSPRPLVRNEQRDRFGLE